MPHTLGILKDLFIYVFEIFEEDVEGPNNQINYHYYPLIFIAICIAICLALPMVTLLILFRLSRLSIHTLKTRQYTFPRNLDDYIHLAKALINLILDCTEDFGDAATDLWLEEVGQYGLDADVLARPMGYILVLAILPFQAITLGVRFGIPFALWILDHS
jgi:hypothetical protein